MQREKKRGRETETLQFLTSSQLLSFRVWLHFPHRHLETPLYPYEGGVDLGSLHLFRTAVLTFVERLLCARHCSMHFPRANLLNPRNTLYHVHFTDEGTQATRW